MLLKLNLELSIGKYFEVQLSAVSQTYINRAIQGIIATIIFILKIAKELFEKS